MLPKRLGRHIESENMRRFLKGLPLPDILKGDEDEESDAAETAKAEADEEDNEGDFLLEESARVLADYINLSERQISAVGDF